MANDLPPGVHEVGRVPGDKPGSYWVLGSDGGVFAVGGSSFYGAYTTLPSDQRQGTRTFSGIVANSRGGYTLISDHGEKYDFSPPPIQQPTTPVNPPNAPATSTVTPEQGKNPLSGQAIVQDVLKQYGLDPTLGTKMLNDYLDSGSEDYMMQQLRQTDQYKTRFAGLEARRKNGYAPMSEAQYVQWEGATKSLFNHYGLPPDFYDQPEELAQFIGNDVSPTELKSRIENGYVQAMSTDPQTKLALQQMYGIDDGHLAAFFLDPTKGEELIKKRWTAAQIGGEALKNSFGGLTQEEAERLAGKGLTDQGAQQAFGVLGQQHELFGTMPGEQEDQTISRQTQLGAVEGDVAAQQQIARKADQRKSTFGGGGGFAGGQGGLSGLGEAT